MGDLRASLIPHSDGIRKTMGEGFGVDLRKARATAPTWENFEQHRLDQLEGWETKTWDEPERFTIQAERKDAKGFSETLEFTVRKQEFEDCGFISLGAFFPSFWSYDWFVQTCERMFGDVYIFDSQYSELYLLKNYGCLPPPETP